MNIASAVAGVCTWSAENLRAFWIPVGAALIGGIIGGIAEHSTHFRLSKDGALVYDGAVISREARRSLRAISSVIGGAGALGALFVLVSTRWWDNQAKDSPSLALFIFTMAVLAGFGARRLLPRLAERLEKKVEEALRVAQDADSKSEEAKQRAIAVEATAEENQDVAKAMATLRDSNPPPSELFTSIDKLREHVRNDPLKRTTVIVLGRLFRAVNLLDLAIDALSDYVERKDKVVPTGDADTADALYNRACYRTILWRRTADIGDNTKTATLRSRLFADLRRSFQIKPRNAEDAATDSDFDCLREDQEFIRLLVEFSRPTATSSSPRP